MKTVTVTKRDLYTVYCGSSDAYDATKRQQVQEYALNKVFAGSDEGKFASEVELVKKQATQFCMHLFNRLVTTCRRNRTRFEIRFKDWLESTLTFPRSPSESVPKNTARGRPRLNFQTANEVTKRKIAATLQTGNSASSLVFASSLQFRKEGNEAAAKLTKMIYDSKPEECAKMLKNCKEPSVEKPVCASAEKSLSLLVDGDFSKSQYQLVRKFCSSQSVDVVVPYNSVRECKNHAYPQRSEIKISGNKAEVTLQALLDHNTERILQYLESNEKYAYLQEALPDNAELIFHHKWGFDASGDHPRYQQDLVDGPLSTDLNFFLTAISPLRLTTPDSAIVWKNRAPGSVRFCRPLHLQFKKDDAVSVKEEEKYFSDQIAQLQPTKVNRFGKTVVVSHKLSLTMIDGKTRSYLTDSTSFSNCPLCGAKPTQMCMGNLQVNASAFAYGMSTLHVRIRFLECILHISYRLDIKKRRVNESLYKERKRRIQNDFKNKMGILVDVVKRGTGNSNCGNTARTVFSDPRKTAEITGIDQNLIERFAYIQDALSSVEQEIDLLIFEAYAKETADLYKRLYPWYYMPPTVHLVLYHGADTMRHIELPIGIFTEEALEACNKIIRNFREHRTRKCSAISTMEDLILRLLLLGDLYLAAMNWDERRKKGHHTSRGQNPLLKYF